MYKIQDVSQRNGKPQYIVNGGWTFDSEAEAQAYCDTQNGHWSAMARLDAVPAALNRADYERIATEMGIAILSDAECDSYGLHYGEFAPPAYTTEQCLRFGLARRRMLGIKREREARPQPVVRQPDYPQGRELDCGHIVFWQNEVMRASLGTACFDCYDRMS